MKTTEQKIALFQACFPGRTDVYGTYDPMTGRTYQVKQAVTDQVILAHLLGRRPYGAYLLVGEQTLAAAADFDAEDPGPPLAFIHQAEHYGIPVYLERSKRKGWHCWVFMAHPGVSAAKARLVVKLVLDDIDQPTTEVFPKQDRTTTGSPYGNFINLPLWGQAVKHGRTVFVDLAGGLKPHADQWTVLEQVHRVSEHQLDEIIQLNDLGPAPSAVQGGHATLSDGAGRTFGLMPCAIRMLREGVTANQRVACFRLAVQLKRTGLPKDLTVAALRAWARKNRPAAGKRILTDKEIVAQVEFVCRRDYSGFGCDSEAVGPYCDSYCPLKVRWSAQTPAFDPASDKGAGPSGPDEHAHRTG